MRSWFRAGSLLPISKIGVDLGTANTLVSVDGEGIVLNEPSVVALETQSGRTVGIGLDAKRMLGRTPSGIAAIRPVKDGVIADVDITELMIRHFLTQVMTKKFLKIRPLVLVGVPSGITELERRAVRSSAHAAGAKEVYMVAEPMAAAIGMGLPVETASGNMIIDIGGGTSEIAVIALSGSVADTSIRIGGDEMDAAIVAHIRKAHSLLIGDPTAEAIKVQLGMAHSPEDEKEKTMLVRGRDLINGVPVEVEIKSSEICECLQDPIQQIVAAVRRALEVTPPELASDIVERGIIMTGGGALLRGLDVAVSKDTGLKIHVDDDPLTCVVRGCGKILDELGRYRAVLTK